MKKGMSIAVTFFLIAFPCFADGHKDNPDEQVNTASDASFDKRLPPVLPGEEVNDSGKRMKVWSTSGSVTDNVNANATPAARVDDIDVIVDERGIVKRRKGSKDLDRE